MPCVVSFRTQVFPDWYWPSVIGLLIHFVPGVLEEQAAPNTITQQLIWWTSVPLLQDSPGLTHYCHLLDAVLTHRSSNIHHTCNQQLNHGWPSWVSHLGPTYILAEEIKNLQTTAEPWIPVSRRKIPNLFFDTLLERIVTPISKYELTKLNVTLSRFSPEKQDQMDNKAANASLANTAAANCDEVVTLGDVLLMSNRN